jgi:hypothetical protein
MLCLAIPGNLTRFEVFGNSDKIAPGYVVSADGVVGLAVRSR